MVKRLQMVVKVFNAIHGEVEQCSFLRKRLCLIFLEVEQYGTLISQFCKNDFSAQKPELPAEITLKPYGDPRNVMISR